MTTDPATLKALAVLAAYFPRMALEASGRLALWANKIADIPPDLLMTAVNTYVETSKSPWGPTIGELRELSLGVGCTDIDETSADAWSHVVSEMHRVHYYGTPNLSGATVQAAKVLGGWSTFCLSLERDMSAHRARFIEAYKEARRKYDRDRLLTAGTKESMKALADVQRYRLEGGSDD